MSTVNSYFPIIDKLSNHCLDKPNEGKEENKETKTTSLKGIQPQRSYYVSQESVVCNSLTAHAFAHQANRRLLFFSAFGTAQYFARLQR